jgi:hypothetical protein
MTENTEQQQQVRAAVERLEAVVGEVEAFVLLQERLYTRLEVSEELSGMISYEAHLKHKLSSTAKEVDEVLANTYGVPYRVEEA